ncbi:MAG: hypothetical protein A3J24_00885 [Deltaproteobacteria bacterium RIFCSPLOWO2_02_FULL_53_8]|nr:MAG: hypothetical protein A3J24_00885 [Deltaproteobacteria bacterium RIFCSPLOWO2_02_FULL_53_8]
MTLKRFAYVPALVLMVFLTFGCGAGNTIKVADNADPAAKDKAASDTTGAAEAAAIDEAPLAAPQLVLGPGDKVDISVYRNDDFKMTRVIDVTGKIMLPLLGDVQAAGLTQFQLRDSIRDGLSKFLVDPQVYVGTSSTISQKVIVMGEVTTPVVVQISGPMNVLEALTRAGGVKAVGKSSSIILVRGGLQKPTVMALNLEDVSSGRGFRDNINLQSGDIVYVPRTFIADVDSFFSHFATIVGPLLSVETGYFIGSSIESSNPGNAAVSTR